MDDAPTPPPLGQPIPAAFPSAEALKLLALRRSASLTSGLTAPGPDPATLDRLLTIAARVPDHRRVTPFRFVVFEGEGRARAGEALAAALTRADPDAKAEAGDAERLRFMRAPVVVAVVSRTDPTHKTPEWEQVLTAGAVCQNLLLAASASGFAGQWITEWCAYDENVKAAFGVAPAERVAGFVYLGTAVEDPLERPRPDMGAIVTRF